MAFDPDAFLLEEDEEETIQQQPAQRVPSVGFDPDAFLAEEETEFAQPTTAAQPAYQYDPSGFRRKKPVAPEEKPEEQGILRQVADIPLGIARGGVTGIKMMTDILGADNPVSKSLSGVEGYMSDLMSAQAKEDQQEISRIMKDAEDKGFGEQVKAGIKAFSIAPVDIMSQALGTMAPVIATGLAGSAAKLGALGMRAVQAGVGAGMGAGMIKGEIYNEVKNELVNSGISEDAAEKAAAEAQAYGGKNLDQILLGAGLGAASTLGAEGIITRILTKQGTAPAAGVVSRVLKGGITEAVPEAAQAAQEQLAKNVALQREGFDVDPSRGVVAAATMEAVAAAPLGGIAGAVERPAPIKTLAEENLEQTNEIARKVAENGAPLTASAIQDQAAANLRQDELAKQLEAQLEEELVAVKEPTAAPPAIQSKEEFAAIYSQVAPEELDAAEAGFTEQAATAETEEGRINAQNALEAIKEIKATVTPPAPPVAPTITPEVTPAVPTAQPPTPDATQEIIQPEGVRQEPQDRVEVRPTEEAGVGDSILGAARGEEEGQVATTPTVKEGLTVQPTPIEQPFTTTTGDAEIDAKITKTESMSPDEYLRQAWEATGGKLGVSYEEWLSSNRLTDADRARYSQAMISGEKFPLPYIDKYGGSQDGRNRALAAKEAGIEVIPVGIIEEPSTDVQIQDLRKELSLTKSKIGKARIQERINKLESTLTPTISEITPTSELVGEQPVQPTIREVPEISPIVGAEPAAIVEQEPVAPAEEAPARKLITQENLPDYARMAVMDTSAEIRTNIGGSLNAPDPFEGSSWEQVNIPISEVEATPKTFIPRDSITKGPIVIDAAGKVIDGNNRLYEARQRGEKTIEAFVQRSIPAKAVDAYNITLPEGYTKQGELYVYQPAAPTVTEAPAAPEVKQVQTKEDFRKRFLAEEVTVTKDDPRFSKSTVKRFGLGQANVIEQKNLSEIVDSPSVFHETNLQSIRNIVSRIKQGPRNVDLWASNSLDLALGQGGKGYVIELDTQSVNGSVAKSLAANIMSGIGAKETEIKVNKTLPQSIKSIIAPSNAGVNALRKTAGFERLFDFDNATKTERGIRIPVKQKPAAAAEPAAPTPVTTPPVTEAVTPAPEAAPATVERKSLEFVPQEVLEAFSENQPIMERIRKDALEKRGGSLQTYITTSVRTKGVPKSQIQPITNKILKQFQESATIAEIEEAVSSEVENISSIKEKKKSDDAKLESALQRIGETYELDAAIQDYKNKQIELERAQKSMLITPALRREERVSAKNNLEKSKQKLIEVASKTIVSKPTPAVSETITPAEPVGISVGNRIKLGKSPQTYTIEEVIPQSATERELGEQYYSVKNERTGETQVVEARDLRQVKGKGARKIATTAIDTTPEGILITPPDQQYTFEEVFDVAYDMFGGEIPEGFTIVNDSKDKDFEFKAAYIPESGEIIVNLAYLNKNDDIRDAITHELGHYIYGDPEFRAAFDQFIASLSPEARADLDAYVDTAYNKETGEIRLEEKMVRAFVDQFINEEQAPAWRSMLDAIKRFLNKLGFKFNISDRDAISVFTAALDRYKAGEAISREGGARLMAAEPRREQVAGMEREEARYITTPEGIIKQTNDVLREKFFDGTTVSPEKTTEAWGYISRLLDIKSGAANEFAGQINDVVDQDTNSEARMGASLFSVSLANYAAKLAAQGDSKMLRFMIRNVNSMPVDKYAGGKSAAGKALRAAREYDIDGYGAIKVEVKAKIERTAATLFGTGSPTEAQFKAVEGAIKESDAQELGNPEEVAQEVEKVEKRTKRKITDKIEKIIGKGSLKGIIQAIKETPLEKQQDAGWIEKVVNDFLVNAGLSPEVAATASKLYESLIAERLAAARQKAFEDNLNKSAPWKDYLARNSRLAKDALKKIQEAIRTGALDPEQNVESIIAAESGWSGFTKDQYQKIVQLDSVINDPKQDDVTRREAMADLNKVISDAKLPVRFKDALGAYYVGNALMGIPTLTVNIASPIGFTIRNLMTDVSKFAFTDPARIPVAFETFMESMRSWYDQTSYAFKNQIYLNDVVEYLQGQNVLRELFDKGKKQWAQGKYAEGFVNMAVGMTQITGRVLSSLDQGAISMLENQNITRYALEALANTKGKVPKDKLKEFANMVIDTRRKTIAQSIANGMPRDRAGVLADLAVKSEVISALSQYDINPMNVLDASINDALQSVGRNKTLTIKGVEESQQRISDSGFLSYLPIKMLEDVAQASGREGSAMQIFAKMLYGFALVPARVFHNVAWFSPYGFIRLGIDKYKKNKGEDSPYAMSLQTEAQYKQRLTEAIAGSVAMLGLAALSSASSDEDDDKKFKIVITGNGPSATTDKQYFDSWMKKWKPYSVHIVVNGNIIPINIGRGGEALFFPIMLAGALDDWKIKQKQNLTKKEPEDLSAIAQMLGSSFFALAQRGPYAAFTKPLFDASKDGRVTEELASQAGFFGKTFIPVLGSSLARNISDLFNDPVDRSSIEGAIYANTPVVGPWLGTKALNALGQPIRADDWGDRLYKLGVPVVFSFPKETPMNELNELILKQGSGPTIPTRANAQKRFGDILTDKEFETYVREYGRVMSDKMFKSRTKLANMKPADYDDQLEKYARGYSIDGIKIKGASDSAVLAVKRMRQ